MKKFLLSVICIFATALALQGQQPELRFKHLGVEDGLSHSLVSDIVEDTLGYIWIGTQDGLNRYDGYEFVVYKHDPEDPDSLSDSFVMALYDDPSGTIWVGTNNGGLNSFDRRTERFTRYRSDPDDPNSLSSETVASIFEDSQGKMNLSLKDVGGELLVVSQFTLLGDCRKGRRPSFTGAAPPDEASRLYTYFAEKAADAGMSVQTGKFQANMDVSLVNQGPVTLMLESKPK